MAELALRDYLNEIDRLIERSSNDEAIQHCRHLLSQHPKCVETYRLLGKALLEKEEDRAAQDVFERVLSVDPEDFVARVGLSIIHDRNNELDPAVWHMERAFDIAPSNELIQGELRRLYARRDGAAPERIALTRSALARMYTKGDLYDEAIADLRKLLAAQPDRIDLQIQLAEALWRNEQRLDAIEWTQRVTRRLPHCVKANLINGAVLRENGEIAESDALFKRVQAIDPENQYAEELFGPDTPLPRETLMVSRLALRGTEELLEAAEPIAEVEEVPEWLRGITDLGALPLEEGESYPALAAGTPLPEAAPAAEIPDWLQGLSESTAPAVEEQVPNWLAALAGGAAVAAVAGREEEEAETPIAPPGEEEVPDWLAALAGGAAAAAVAGREEEEAEIPIAPPGEEEVPDWLSSLSASAGSIEAAAPVMPSEEAAEETPDWLAQLQEAAPSPFSTTDAMGLEPQEETPDWLAQLQAAMPPVTEKTGEAETPDWLRALSASVETDQLAESPAEASGALAGLAAAGAAAAGAARWVQTDEEQVEEGQPAESLLPAAAEVESIQVAGPESISFDVTSPVAAEAAAPELPEEMPSADDALAFLARLAAGKEDQLRAEAEAEAEARMSEIMGRKAEAKPSAPPKPEDKLAPVKMTVAAATVAAVAAGLVAKKDKQEEPQAIEARTEVEAPKAEAAAPELPEEMPSADDALAFLARLAAGKEDQLRAEAEAEAEARMSEIMGRKAKAKPAAPKVEQLSTEAAVETTPESELPDWLRTMRPPEEALSQSAAEEIFATPEGELPDWLHAMQPTGESAGEGSLYEGLFTETPAEGEIETTPESELPDWLKPMRPFDNLLTESELLEGEETEWPAAAPTGESLGTGFEDRPAESGLLSGLAALFEEEEFAAPPAEPISEVPAEVDVSFGVTALTEELSLTRKQPIDWWTQSAEDEGEESYQLPVSQQAGSLSPDWWVQAAQDEGEEPLSQLPAFQETPLAVATGLEAATASGGKKQTQPLPKTGPLSKTGPLPKTQTGPIGSAEVQSSIESLLSRLHVNAEDHDARLELARTYWAIGKREDAFGTYARLAMSYTSAKEIVPDLESITEIQDQPDWHRLMGDVYMKAGKLTDALDHYRRALSEL